MPKYNFYIPNNFLAYFSFNLSLIVSTESNLGYSAYDQVSAENQCFRRTHNIVPQIQIAWVEFLCLYQWIEVYGGAYIFLCIF